MTLKDGSHYSVIVIGAGPNGLTLANLLGKYGIKAAIFDRNPTTVQLPRAVSIDDEALRTLQIADADKAILEMMASGYGSHYYSPDGVCFAKVEPQSTENGFQKRNAFHQPEMELSLRENLVKYPNVEVYFSHEMTDFTQDTDKVSISIKTDDGRTLNLSADYLVGSDGARSEIRQAIGAELVGSSYEERWLIIDIENTSNRFRHTQVFCDPKRSCISLPGPGRTRRFEMMIHKDEDEEKLTSTESINQLLKYYGEENPIIKRIQPYPFHARIANKWQEGRVFLCGDAAHLTPPFAGQGLNSGARDAGNLAWKLAWVVKGILPPKILETYAQERPKHAWDLIQMAVTLGRIMMPKTKFQGKLTQWAFQALAIVPSIKSYIAELKYRPKPQFTEGFLIPDNRSKKATIVGKLFPQPIVEFPNRETKRLDYVIEEGFALIAYDIDPTNGMENPQIKEIEKLGIKVIGMTPIRYNPIISHPCVRNTSEDAKIDAYLGHYILLRPDRMVAATLPIKDGAKLLEYIKPLFS